MSKLPAATIRPEDYSHSPAHHAVVTRDHAALTRLVSTLPRLPSTSDSFPRTEADSLALDRIADKISSLLDRREDIPFRETPLHLAVRLSDVFAARTLASAGADISLQNSAGWNPLQEALCRRSSEIALVLLHHHHIAAWAKWRRRLPRIVAALRRMRDFYMEISFHFESSLVPFVGRIAPSDTYKIWKREGNLRADTSLSGFDGLKIQRADQSFLFLGDGDRDNAVSEGSLLVLNHDEGRIYDAFENAGTPMTDADVAGFVSQTSVYRPGMDVTNADLVPRTNWRRQEKLESVGDWKAKVYDVHNVVFSFRSRKIAGASDGDLAAAAGSEQVLPLELDEDSEEGFLVMENPNFAADNRRHSSFIGGADNRRHSSFVRDDREWITVSRKSVDINLAPPQHPSAERRRASVAAPAPPRLPPRPITAAPAPPTKEKEFVKSLKPSVWLTDHFPLKTDEILPLLDILANKVKAVRRMRELLTTKFPPGTFPVKIAIPVVPTVRVVITFTKFVELPPTEIFYTPLSSPTHLKSGQQTHSSEDRTGSTAYSSCSPPSSSSSRASTSARSSQSNSSSHVSLSSKQQQQNDPFAIPGVYKWTNMENKNNKMKKSKSVRKSK